MPAVNLQNITFLSNGERANATILNRPLITLRDNIVAQNVPLNQLINSYDNSFVEVYTALGGESQITIPNGKEYGVGAGHLQVAIEGNMQLVGIDYSEDSPTQISFFQNLSENEKVTIRRIMK